MNYNINPLNILGEGALNIFGSAVVVALVLIAIMIYLLLSVGADASVMVVILIPVITTMAGAGVSSYVSISGSFLWINIIMFAILGAIFSSVYWVVTR